MKGALRFRHWRDVGKGGREKPGCIWSKWRKVFVGGCVGACSSLMGNQPVILVADDDANDVLLLERAFGKAKVLCQFEVVRDGQEAMLI
jgi:hypothetical protein